MTPPGGFVFDAYGTLFDVHSVIEAGREITQDPQTLSLAWQIGRASCRERVLAGV